MVIYCIINKKNNKKYIGSAYNFNRRKNNHLSQLKKNKHHSQPLQNSWNKHNECDFEFIVLEEVVNKDFLIEREQWWLDNIHPEYNICKIAGNCSGRKHSEESKRKISWFNSNKRVFSEETRNKISKSKKGVKRDSSKWDKKYINKKIYQYDKKGLYLKEWLSCKEIADFYSKPISRIYNSIFNNSLFLKKYRFSYIKTDVLDITNFKTKEKKILQYDLNGDLVKEWNSINEAKEFFTIKNSSISNCLIGESKTAIGFIWKYKNN